MSKKRKPQGKSQKPKAAARVENVEKVAPPPELPKAEVLSASRSSDVAPIFWFGFEVSWAKLLVGRVLLFGLLAADALLAIRHAPRYGAGGFNVANLPFLDGLGPTRVSYAVTQLVLAHLFVLAACGMATRVVVPIAATLYAWLYFGSQLDSYQHHYLVVMILVIASFIPWKRPENAEADTPVRTWALRLLLVQLAILYLWAAISKMSPAWTDGRTLSMQIVTAPDRINIRGAIDATIGMAAMSKLIIATELSLAATIWWKRAWPFVAPIGILFHLGIVVAKFDIGLFAWLMIGIYAFVIPDRIWIAIVAHIPKPKLPSQRVVGIALGLGAVVLVMLSRFHYANVIGTILVGLTIGGGFTTRLVPVALACFASMLLWTAIDRGTDVATDYYRFWGGSSRRLGDVEQSQKAYEAMTQIAPDDPSGHYQLGKLLLDKNDSINGLLQLHHAQELEPNRARAFIAEAQWLSAQGRTKEAIEAARKGTFAEPSSSEARQLLDRLSK